MIDYKEKYLKYKEKYLNLKMIGGENLEYKVSLENKLNEYNNNFKTIEKKLEENCLIIGYNKIKIIELLLSDVNKPIYIKNFKNIDEIRNSPNEIQKINKKNNIEKIKFVTINKTSEKDDFFFFKIYTKTDEIIKLYSEYIKNHKKEIEKNIKYYECSKIELDEYNSLKNKYKSYLGSIKKPKRRSFVKKLLQVDIDGISNNNKYKNIDLNKNNYNYIKCYYQSLFTEEYKDLVVDKESDVEVNDTKISFDNLLNVIFTKDNYDLMNLLIIPDEINRIYLIKDIIDYLNKFLINIYESYLNNPTNKKFKLLEPLINKYEFYLSTLLNLSNFNESRINIESQIIDPKLLNSYYYHNLNKSENFYVKACIVYEFLNEIIKHEKNIYILNKYESKLNNLKNLIKDPEKFYIYSLKYFIIPVNSNKSYYNIILRLFFTNIVKLNLSPEDYNKLIQLPITKEIEEEIKINKNLYITEEEKIKNNNNDKKEKLFNEYDKYRSLNIKQSKLKKKSKNLKKIEKEIIEFEKKKNIHVKKSHELIKEQRLSIGNLKKKINEILRNIYDPSKFINNWIEKLKANSNYHDELLLKIKQQKIDFKELILFSSYLQFGTIINEHNGILIKKKSGKIFNYSIKYKTLDIDDDLITNCRYTNLENYNIDLSSYNKILNINLKYYDYNYLYFKDNDTFKKLRLNELKENSDIRFTRFKNKKINSYNLSLIISINYLDVYYQANITCTKTDNAFLNKDLFNHNFDILFFGNKPRNLYFLYDIKINKLYDYDNNDLKVKKTFQIILNRILLKQIILSANNDLPFNKEETFNCYFSLQNMETYLQKLTYISNFKINVKKADYFGKFKKDLVIKDIIRI